MKKTLSVNVIIGLVAVTAIFLGLSIFGGATSQATGNPHRVIVTMEDGAVNGNTQATIKNMGGKVVKNLPLVNGLVVLLPSEASVPQVRALAGVKRVEPDVKVFAHRPPTKCSPWPTCKNDPTPTPDPTPIPSQTPTPTPTDTQVLEWGVDRIDADLAWTTNTGYGINVAIIDSGIDKDHADLNVQGGINFVSKNWARPADPNKWDDDNGHGTHVAGVVSALDNEIGVVGVAPQASLFAVKVLDKNGSGYISNVIAGIEWAIENNIQVINMSLGSPSDIQTLHDAVDLAYTSGIIIVASAGNEGDGDVETNNVGYPARYSSVIAVSATDINDVAPIWSSDGEEVEISAPGVNIRSTWKDGIYHTISGTSMASPHVAGTVALMLSSSTLSTEDIREILRNTADDLGATGFDNFYGHGLVDAEESQF